MKRRAFLQCIAAVPAVNAMSARSAATSYTRLRYVARDREIQVWRRGAMRWELVQRIPSDRPGSLLLSPQRSVLFAVNQIDEYEGLPAGTVESFAVDVSSGKIRSIGKRMLSLSSTFPRGCALSPDGRHLVVTAFGGGTLNVLAIRDGGAIGPVCHVRKEVGRGADPVKQRSAHPHSVVFHPSGRFVIATDFGSDRISVFGFADGCLSPIAQLATPPGSGPGPIAFDASGTVFAVHHELNGDAARYEFRNGTLLRKL